MISITTLSLVAMVALPVLLLAALPLIANENLRPVRIEQNNPNNQHRRKSL